MIVETNRLKSYVCLLEREAVCGVSFSVRVVTSSCASFHALHERELVSEEVMPWRFDNKQPSIKHMQIKL